MTAVTSKDASLKSRFISGSSWALLGKIISSASTLVVNILLARLLSTEDMGSFFLVFSIVSTFTVIAQWGLGRGLVKLIASELAGGNAGRARNAITSSFVIVVSMSLVLSMLVYSPSGEWFLNKLSGADILSSITGLIGLWILVLSLQGIVSESFRGFHDIRTATIFGGMLTAVIAMLFYLYVWLQSGQLDLAGAVQLMVFATATGLIVGGTFLVNKVRKYEPGSNTELSNVFRFGLPLMLTNISLFATLEFHIWILAYYQPETEVALYGASLRLVLLLAMPLTIINAVIPPMIADMYSLKQYGRVQNLLQKSATIISVPAFFIFVLIVFYGEDILGLVYGDAYKQAYIPFSILAIGQLVNVLTGSPGILLTMSGHERVVMKTAMGASVLGVIASLIGVQIYGAIGAALGYSIGVIVNNVVMSMYSINKLSISTHGSFSIMKEMFRRIRLRIESDEINGGPLALLGMPVSKLELFLWDVRGCEVIECFGDSHAAIFRGLNYKSWIGKKRFRATSVKGATAYGVGNPNSKTNALEIFRKRLKELPEERSIIFMMGEVDIGFLIWLRAKNKDVTAMECMEETFDRYTNFLSEVKMGHPNIKLCSVPLPTINDYECNGDVAGARSEISATQIERTNMTLKFNLKLKSWALKNIIEYIDFDVCALDDKTGLVKKTLLNKNISDHHYCDEEFYNMFKKLFNL